MKSIQIEDAVGSLVAVQASRSRVFEAYGIDYCCSGAKRLDEACAEKQLDLSKVIAELQRSDAKAPAADLNDWPSKSIAQLTRHITEVHHDFLRAELPRLSQLVGKIASVHGPNHPSLLDVRATFDRLRGEIEAHMAAEEELLFPALRLLTSIGKFDMLANPALGLMSKMEQEHKSVGELLSRIKYLTDGYCLPPDGCNTYRAALHGLMSLEQDLHVHIHKENNILFPKALAAAA